MSLPDQRLRQELMNYGESVPPITQRNREELRNRLEVLRSQTRSRATASSPTRNRSNVSTNNTSASRPPTRSRPIPGLIELSDSETDTPSTDYLTSRSKGTGANIQTRSIPVNRQFEPTSPPAKSSFTDDVEQSLARHRREIQQLLDSARDKARSMNISNSSGQRQQPPPTTTPFRPSSSSNYQRQQSKSNYENSKQPSWFNRSRKAIKSFWEDHQNIIIKCIKALLFGLLMGVGLIFLKNKGGDLIPHRKGITCTVENATECDEMIPVINAVRKQLQIRTGEVDCGFRPKSDLYVTRHDIDKYLDEKGFKFESNKQDRWEALITYIFNKPVEDIEVYDNTNELTQSVTSAHKLSTSEGIRSLTCRARKTVNSAMHHLAWVLLGTTSFLSLIWFLKRRSKQHEENENTYKDFIQKIINLLENQYEEHLHDQETKPWLAISHIRDMLVPSEDRKRLKTLWERAKKQISENESRVRAESQLIHGEEFDVWRWIQPRSSSSPSSPRKNRMESPKNSNEESYVYMPSDIGLTECLKLRNFFGPDNIADDDEIDLVVDSIQNRCATIRRIEHIGIHAVYVYLKFSSKEAAAQGFHLLSNWNYHGREIIAKYLRLERYHEHFPEARDSSLTNN